MLLQPEEKTLCQQLAAGQPPHSQRAIALLALDGGATQTAAAGLSGQTVGQVRYWLSKFEKNRMGIFPDELLAQPEPESLSSASSADRPALTGALESDQPISESPPLETAIEAPVKAEQVKKAKSKTKKKSKKAKKSKQAKKKTSKPGKKRQEKKPKKGKKKAKTKKQADKKTGKKKGKK